MKQQENTNKFGSVHNTVQEILILRFIIVKFLPQKTLLP